MQHQQRHGNRQNVRQLRMSPTDAEKELWNLLRGRRFHGLKFRRQHRIGMNILDFYCPALRLVIELDGEHHFTEDGKRWDKVRDAMLAAGHTRDPYRELRIPEKAVSHSRRDRGSAPQFPSPRGIGRRRRRCGLRGEGLGVRGNSGTASGRIAPHPLPLSPGFRFSSVFCISSGERGRFALDAFIADSPTPPSTASAPPPPPRASRSPRRWPVWWVRGRRSRGG
jgi:very-short-patch-repair endonuclease